MHDDEIPQSLQSVAPTDALAADAIPKHTTPTWESELLLSGATVFGLLQLPSTLYPLIDRLHHQLPAMWDGVVLLGTIFSLSLVYALILAFLLHLATRAYWVALVGLRSVYPNGIRWDRVSSGPIGKRVQQALFDDQDALIERADNFSTLVFSTGIAIVFSVLVSVIAAIVPALLGIAMQRWVWPLPNPTEWFMIAMALVVVPLVLPRLVDRIVGSRLAPEGRAARTLAALQFKTSAVGPWRMAAPLMLNLTTNMRHRYGFVVFIVLIYALIFGVSTVEIWRHGKVGAFDSGLQLQSMPGRQIGDYYEDTGQQARLLPRIQSDIVTAPYLRLWVPLDPHRMGAFTRACGIRSIAPGHRVEPAPRDSALNACLGNVVAPRLDGRSLTSLVWHPYRDDVLGVDGLHTYIPIQSLASGEHELLLTPPKPDNAEPGDVIESWRIPFWR